MSEIEYTRQQTLRNIEEARQLKSETQELCEDIRQTIWRIKRLLEDPSLEDAQRVEYEDLMFERLQALKSMEEEIERLDDVIDDGQYSLQRLDTATDNENTATIVFGALIAIAIIGFLLFIFSQ